MDQLLVEQIAGLYEGSFHGNSRFMKRMKIEPQDVQEAVKALLQSRGTTTPTAAAPVAKWEIKMPLEELVSIHLNAAGYPNTWFVQNFKKLSSANQDLVNARLVAIGHQPYGVRAGKKSSTPPPPPTPPRVLSAEEQAQVTKLSEALQELYADRQRVRIFLTNLDNVINDHGRQMADLQGIPYVPQPVYDPFKTDYKPAHTHARKNKDEVLASANCGCFFCRATFAPAVINEWCDNGQTALCPRCGIDAVLGDRSGYPISDEFLLAMFKEWFSVPLRIRAGAPDVTQVIQNVKIIAGTKEGVPHFPEVPPPAPQLPPVPPPPPAPKVYAPPTHLTESTPVGLGAALVGAIPDGEDDEPEEL